MNMDIDKIYDILNIDDIISNIEYIRDDYFEKLCKENKLDQYDDDYIIKNIVMKRNNLLKYIQFKNENSLLKCVSKDINIIKYYNFKSKKDKYILYNSFYKENFELFSDIIKK